MANQPEVGSCDPIWKWTGVESIFSISLNGTVRRSENIKTPELSGVGKVSLSMAHSARQIKETRWTIWALLSLSACHQGDFDWLLHRPWHTTLICCTFTFQARTRLFLIILLPSSTHTYGVSSTTSPTTIAQCLGGEATFNVLFINIHQHFISEGDSLSLPITI